MPYFDIQSMAPYPLNSGGGGSSSFYLKQEIERLNKNLEDVNNLYASATNSLSLKEKELRENERYYKTEIDKLKSKISNLEEEIKNNKNLIKTFNKLDNKIEEYVDIHRSKNKFDSEVGIFDVNIPSKESTINKKLTFILDRLTTYEKVLAEKQDSINRLYSYYDNLYIQVLKYNKSVEKYSDYDWEKIIKLSKTKEEYLYNIETYYKKFNKLPIFLEGLCEITKDIKDFDSWILKQELSDELYLYLYFTYINRQNKFELREDIAKKIIRKHSLYYRLYECFIYKTSYDLSVMRIENSKEVFDILQNKNVIDIPFDYDILVKKLEELEESDEDSRYKKWVHDLFYPLIEPYVKYDEILKLKKESSYSCNTITGSIHDLENNIWYSKPDTITYEDYILKHNLY
jgi:hypothetical protein